MGVVIRFKDREPLMRWLGRLLFFNKGFMERFTTTIGNKVYFPSREYVQEDYLRASVILAHELVHVEDSLEMGKVAFSLAYLFPQCFVLLALPVGLLTHHPWWMILLCDVAFLLPWPAIYRTEFEMRAYAVSRAIRCAIMGQPQSKAMTMGYAHQFTGPDYYWMWPFPKEVDLMLEASDAVTASGHTFQGQIPVGYKAVELAKAWRLAA